MWSGAGLHIFPTTSARTGIACNGGAESAQKVITLCPHVAGASVLR